MNPEGSEKSKSKCKLPVKEPNGMMNRNGMIAAMGRISQTDIPTEEKRKAAKKLANMMKSNDMQPSRNLVMMAGMM